MSWCLKRLKQCDKCPWKKSTNPYDIPNGYSVENHLNLEVTIAKNLTWNNQLNVMSCHEHDTKEEVMCLGWLYNQLGPGNNIGLRLRMFDCTNRNDWEIVGEQHETFEDTVPND